MDSKKLNSLLVATSKKDKVYVQHEGDTVYVANHVFAVQTHKDNLTGFFGKYPSLYSETGYANMGTAYAGRDVPKVNQLFEEHKDGAKLSVTPLLYTGDEVTSRVLQHETGYATIQEQYHEAFAGHDFRLSAHAMGSLRPVLALNDAGEVTAVIAPTQIDSLDAHLAPIAQAVAV